MKKAIIKGAVLGGVFAFSLFLFGRMMNQNQIDRTAELKDAALPIVVLYDEEQPVNELHGYRTSMNVTRMRDTITPVSHHSEIPFLVRTYGHQIDDIEYEIRSLDGQRLISDGNASEFEADGDQLRTSIPVQNLLEQAVEYNLILKLFQGDDMICYYTRIEDDESCHVREGVKFALNVNDQTFSESTDGLSTYWEPDATGDNSSLHKVTIHSSLKQAGWADLVCNRLTAPIPSVKEMNDSYSVVNLNYVVTTNGENGELEYYNVEEYYRMRYTSERMYLLNFERTMDQIFNGENDALYENYLQLGIREQEVDFLQNEAGTITCFVQEGDLWSYNQTTNRMARVFSFRGQEGIDARENYNQHSIRLLSIDEAGSIDYVVYGYMNRGEHEGQCGVSIQHYDSLTNTNEEELFVAYNSSYQVLKAQFGELLYKNPSNDLYFTCSGTIYHMNLESLETEEIASQLEESTYAVSESGRFVAWVSASSGREITIMDLDRNKSRKLTAKQGKSLRVLGFLQEDLVYGVAAKKHQVTEASGFVQSPMYVLRIVNAQTAEQLKEYRKEQYYIDSVEINEGVLVINRLTRESGGYEAATQDSIVSRNVESDSNIVHTTVTEQKQTQVQLTLSGQRPEGAPVFVAAKEVVPDENREVALQLQERHPSYYAYSRGCVLMESTSISAAIRSADEDMGIVVDEAQNYIWKRSRKLMQQVLNVASSEADMTSVGAAKCTSAMLKFVGVEVHVAELMERGDTPQEILETLLPDAQVLNISGCTLEQMLYFVGNGTPVMAYGENGQAVLLVGYDTLNVAIYDPLTGTVRRSPLEEANNTFSSLGGRYLTFVQQ